MTRPPLTPEDIQIVKEQYEILAKDMLRRQCEGRPITFYHYMLDLTEGPCIYKRISGCGSGTEYMAVTPWGDLFPCHQFVGDEGYKLGNVWDGVTNKPLREEFRSCNAYARPECADCWAKFTAPAAARPTPITLPAPSGAFMNRAASCSRSASNAP